MAKIITITQIKGGVGKSTIALNLLHYFKNNLKTAVVDLDPQGSITNAIEDEALNILPRKALSDKALLAEYEVIIVDSPPYLSRDLKEIYKMSNLIIIPVKAGLFDVMAIDSTIKLVKESLPNSDLRHVKILFNMINTSKTTLTESSESILKDYKLPMFKTKLKERVSYIRGVFLEDGIFSSRDRKAIDEFGAFAKEVLTSLL